MSSTPIEYLRDYSQEEIGRAERVFEIVEPYGDGIYTVRHEYLIDLP